MLLEVTNPTRKPEPCIDGLMVDQLRATLQGSGFRYSMMHDKKGQFGPWTEALILTAQDNQTSESNGLKSLKIAIVPDNRPGRWKYDVYETKGREIQSETVQPARLTSWAGVVQYAQLTARSQTDGDTIANLNLPQEIAGSTELKLEIPFEQIGNYAAQSVLYNAREKGLPAFAIQHPRETSSCEDKLALITENIADYSRYGVIRVAQGAVLKYKTKQGDPALILVVQDSYQDQERRRIDMGAIREKFEIPKKSDLRFDDGDLLQSIGLQSGAVSPLVYNGHNLKAIYFDPSLFEAEKSDRRTVFDFAFKRDQSVFIQPSVMVSALIDHLSIGPYLKL